MGDDGEQQPGRGKRRGGAPRNTTAVAAKPGREKTGVAAEQRKAEILHAAFAEFRDKGFAAARLDDIAKRAGIAKGTVYLYFANKQDLFQEMVLSRVSPLIERMVASGLMAVPVEQRFRIILDAAYQAADDDEARSLLLLMIAEAAKFPELLDFYFRNVVGRGIPALRGLLTSGVARGEIRDAPAAAMPQLVIAPIIVSILWKHLFERYEPLDLDAMKAAHLDLLVHGLRPSGRQGCDGG